MSSEPVKSYLLGTLEENLASSIEERYFTDRAFFLFVQAVETALIEDYLAGRLAPSTRSRFEQRYLTVPDLRRRLEEVRGRQALPTAPEGSGWNIRILLTAAMLLVCFGGAALWVYHDRMRFPALPRSTFVRPVLATISLSPGVVKGEATGMALIRATSEKGDVRLVLELPAQSSPIFCSAQLSVALSDGTWKRVWSTPQPVWSTTFRAGQQLSLNLDSSLLDRGDYQVEVTGADKLIQEAYFFRVSSM